MNKNKRKKKAKQKRCCEHCTCDQIIYLRTGFQYDKDYQPTGYQNQYQCCYCGFKWWEQAG